MGDIKCKLNDCLNYEKKGRIGVCSNYVPPMISKLRPNNIECPFYSTSIEDGMNWLRLQGGMVEAIKNKDKKQKKIKILPFE
ncbi:MAG: hypothetical protein ACOC33_02030 [bacterium]